MIFYIAIAIFWYLRWTLVTYKTTGKVGLAANVANSFLAGLWPITLILIFITVIQIWRNEK